MTVPIFRYGKKQIARRDDGVWFQRRKRSESERKHGARGWGKWEPAPFTERPAGAWFDPACGKAKLP
jgi:hypothetical protein